MKTYHILKHCTMEWSALCSGCFTSSKRTPVTHCVGGRVDPRAGLDAVAKRKNISSCLCRELNPGCQVRSLVTILTEVAIKKAIFFSTSISGVVFLCVVLNFILHLGFRNNILGFIWLKIGTSGGLL